MSIPAVTRERDFQRLVIDAASALGYRHYAALYSIGHWAIFPRHYRLFEVYWKPTTECPRQRVNAPRAGTSRLEVCDAGSFYPHYNPTDNRRALFQRGALCRTPVLRRGDSTSAIVARRTRIKNVGMLCFTTKHGTPTSELRSTDRKDESQLLRFVKSWRWARATIVVRANVSRSITLFRCIFKGRTVPTTSCHVVFDAIYPSTGPTDHGNGHEPMMRVSSVVERLFLMFLVGFALFATSGSGRPNKGQPTERQVQDIIIKMARYLGWKTYHTYDSRRSDIGFPDLCMIHADFAHTIWIEVKGPKGRTRPEQVTWLSWINEQRATRLGIVVFPPDIDAVEQLLRGHPVNIYEHKGVLRVQLPDGDVDALDPATLRKDVA